MSSIPSTKSSQRIWCLVVSCCYLLLRLFKWWNVWNKIWGWHTRPPCRMNTVVQQPWGETQERSCEIFPGSSLIWECLDGCLILLTQVIMILLGPPLGLLLNLRTAVRWQLSRGSSHWQGSLKVRRGCKSLTSPILGGSTCHLYEYLVSLSLGFWHRWGNNSETPT